ncbi:LuxR family transcriptional regulator [Rhodobacteraceae bacterium B1Z28]|uniref:LuxR family transcriptional regulator n=1 Tax=Ruegeria haliotis TaxID=2747601 RepID=A0ABX2PW95_9RHOB|nr:LuxR family transcriptional regulator [Ruegeria haliotis]NVO58482.1 LuxR family transcriptional regulator [Ruegeria haliotis]
MKPDPAPELLAQTVLALDTPQFAQHLMDWLNAGLQFDNFTIVAFIEDQAPEVFLTQATEKRVFERIGSHYADGAYLLDPFYSLHKRGQPDGLYHLIDIAPDQFQRNEYYKSYYQRTTLVDEMAFFSTPAPGVSITACLGRDATTAHRFSNRDLRDARQAAPIANALIRKNWCSLSSVAAATPENPAETLQQRLSEESGINLSPRQAEIALLILQGHSSISIGLTLGISPQTVKVIRKQLYKKCQISSQGELYYLIAPRLSQVR